MSHDAKVPPFRPLSLLSGGILLLFLIVLILRTRAGLEAAGYQWSWNRLPGFLFFRDTETGSFRPGILLRGVGVTLQLSVLSIGFGLALGLLVGLARVIPEPVLRGVSRLYVEVIRGTPLLVQLLVLHFLIGTGFRLTEFASGVTALTIFAAAYIGEIVRGGIEGVDPGQMEASRALGLSWGQAMLHVIMPQAVRGMLAPMAGQFISLIKDSSLVSIIGVTDLTLAGRNAVGSSYLTMETWLTVAALYFALTFPLSLLSRHLERRFSVS